MNLRAERSGARRESVSDSTSDLLDYSGIGVGACYNSQGGTAPFTLASPESANAHESYIKNRRLLEQKLGGFTFAFRSEVFKIAYSEFNDSHANFEKYCGEKNDDFHRLWREADTSARQLINEINKTASLCSSRELF